MTNQHPIPAGLGLCWRTRDLPSREHPDLDARFGANIPDVIHLNHPYHQEGFMVGDTVGGQMRDSCAWFTRHRAERYEDDAMVLRFMEPNLFRKDIALGPDGIKGLVDVMFESPKMSQGRPVNFGRPNSLGVQIIPWGPRFMIGEICTYSDPVTRAGMRINRDQLRWYLSIRAPSATSPVERWAGESRQARQAPYDIFEQWLPLAPRWHTVLDRFGNDPRTGLPILLVRYRHRGLFLRCGTDLKELNPEAKQKPRRRDALNWIDWVHRTDQNSPSPQRDSAKRHTFETLTGVTFAETNSEEAHQRWRDNADTALLAEDEELKANRSADLAAATKRWNELGRN
jgi:hypothetical protein